MSITRRQLLGSSALALSTGWAQAKAKPNVIILLSDDQGYGDLSCHGNPVLKTPALDRLHGESVRFIDFHAAPMCTPTRGQLLTGQDALHNGATSVTAGRAIVRKGIPLMPEIFRAGGYATGIFGKWHIGDTYPYRPMDRGFDTAKYHHGFGISSAVELGNDYANGRYHDNGVTKPFSGYCTDFWFSEAMKFIESCQERKKPFLCYLPTNTPHGPAWVDEKYSKPYKQGTRQAANFFGMIANLDENVAKMEAFLEQKRLKSNTIFIYMTDNGGTGGVATFNAGMRGRKTQLYHGGHRVPCFVRWPEGKLQAPADIDTPAQMQDILPTLIELCELKKPATASFDGTSLAGLLRGQRKTIERMLVVQYGQILKKWDSCVISSKWRLVNGTELYNLDADPAEKNDVAAANPAVLKKMRDHYEAWWAKVEPDLRQYVAISIGAPQQNPVHLCSADWQDIYCDNPNSILNGEAGPTGGPWNIYVERDGEYEIALARWPFDKPLALTAVRPAQKLTYGALPEGKAFPIAGAKLTIAGQQKSMKTQSGAASAMFRVTLQGGTRTQLHGWFQDASGTDLCGAYYARVRRM